MNHLVPLLEGLGRIVDIDRVFAASDDPPQVPFRSSRLIYAAVKQLAPHRVELPGLRLRVRADVDRFRDEIADYAAAVCRDRVVVDYDRCMLVWCADETDAMMMRLRFG